MCGQCVCMCVGHVGRLFRRRWQPPLIYVPTLCCPPALPVRPIPPFGLDLAPPVQYLHTHSVYACGMPPPCPPSPICAHPAMPHICSNEKNAASSAADLRQLFFEQLQIRRTVSGLQHAGGMQQSTPELLEAHQCAAFSPFLSNPAEVKAIQLPLYRSNN